MKGKINGISIEGCALYATGYIKCWLSSYAANRNVSEALLTGLVVELLRSEGQRPSDSVPPLPDSPAEASERVPKVAVAGRPRGRKPSISFRKKMSRVMKARWRASKRAGFTKQLASKKEIEGAV
jgi:hypothetical protein